MSMQGCFVSVSEVDFHAILEKPERAIKVTEKDNDHILKMLEEMKQTEAVQQLREMIQLRKVKNSDEWKPTSAPEFLDIDKSFHGIHFLLTGNDGVGEASDNPLGFILQGGCEIKSQDFGYGPPHAFTAGEVKKINLALAQIDTAELFKNADPKQLTARKIYPEIWDKEKKEHCIGYLISYLDELKEFVTKTAESHRALIVYIG